MAKEKVEASGEGEGRKMSFGSTMEPKRLHEVLIRARAKVKGSFSGVVDFGNGGQERKIEGVRARIFNPK